LSHIEEVLQWEVIGLFLPEVPLSRKTGMEQVAEAESAGSAEAEAESVSSQ